VELREKVAGVTRAAVAPQSELYNGAGEGLSRAFELALTPAIIGGAGYLLDRWLGLVPVFTILFFLVAMAGLMARMYYGYDARMKQHEATSPWAPGGPSGGAMQSPGDAPTQDGQ